MSVTDRQILKNAKAGRLGSKELAAEPLRGVVAQAATKYYQFLVTDFGVAGRAVTTSAIHMPVRGKVVSVSITAPLAVTASTSLYATVTVAKQTGASPTTIATVITNTVAGDATYGTGNLAAAVPFKAPAAMFVLSAVQMAADDVLTVAIAKASTGTALTTASSVVEGTSGTGTDSFSTDYFNICVGVEEN